MKNMSLHLVVEWDDRYLWGFLVQALLHSQNCNSVTIALSTTALQSSIMTSGLELQFCFFKYLRHRENSLLLSATLLKWQRWPVPTQEGEVNDTLKLYPLYLCPSPSAALTMPRRPSGRNIQLKGIQNTQVSKSCSQISCLFHSITIR